MLGLIGKKIGMSQVFDENGIVIPVSVIKAGPCPVVWKKTENENGHNVVQLAFEELRTTKSNLPELGHFRKANLPPYRYLQEFRVDNPDEFKVGELVNVGIFEGVKKVDISGKSKGKGFQGVMKRHGFHGGRKSHGGRGPRSPGSIGMAAYPGKVIKGKKLPGRMGNKLEHIKNLRVVEVDIENNLLLVKGAVPGARNTVLRITAKKST
ncbi:50S ribosomal protein L3 [bacterium]|nr:50S ribosomal protein L3 [bacterium]